MNAQTRLIAIAKPNGNARPIAFGEALNKAAAEALNELFLRSDKTVLRKQHAVIKDTMLVVANIVSSVLITNKGRQISCGE